MCKKCISEEVCACECTEHLSAAQSEFYPFEIIKINCDDCVHGVRRE